MISPFQNTKGVVIAGFTSTASVMLLNTAFPNGVSPSLSLDSMSAFRSISNY